VSRNKIVDAAIKLFSELGYHRTSMDDIAKEANVAKGTLYYHFSGKGELFETIVNDGFAMLMEKIRQELAEDAPADRQIESIVRRHVELFLQYSELVHIISNEITNGIEPDILERIVRRKRDYIAFVADVLRRGHEDGELNELPYELAASAMLGLIESAVLHAVRHPETGTDKLHATINAFVLPALLRKK